MGDSFQEDSFDDDFDDREFVEEVEKRKELNKHVTVVETTLPRQVDLTGEFVQNLDINGNEVTYKRIENIVTFGPTHHVLNYDNLDKFIYPTNFEMRDYQYDIVSKALLKNILCALPTGLGKTFIASTVMLNFYLWTVTAKIIFMAPTRPLVAQQIKACYGITGIPSHDTAILLDKTKKNRAQIWESKRVFFATPQVVENDLKSGFVNPKDIVCLVVDEAHRAKGNYAYNNVIKFIKRFTNSVRILALTATPASDIEGVQVLVTNLCTSKVELRTENSIDTSKYMKKKQIERVSCPPSDFAADLIELMADAATPTLEKCIKFKIYEVNDPYKINAFVAMEASQKIVRNPTISEGLKWMYYFLLQILAVVGQGFRRLNIYGVRNFYSYFKEKHLEFTAKWETKKSTNKYAADFYYHPNIKRILKMCEAKIASDDKESLLGQGTCGLFSHTKFERMIEHLVDFFANSASSNSRVIIFTEFRDSALEIVKVIDTYNLCHRRDLPTDLKPHIFIGQSKEKDKFDDVDFRKKAASKKKGRRTAKQIEKEDQVKMQELEDAKQKKAEVLQKRTVSRVGSSESAQEKGMNQQQQKDVIDNFKKGIYNILVATSIGEEGLDIGEVDMIICFDSTSSPIKNIQRMGRTGRKRDGKVLLLFSSNEESKFDTAMGGYDYIQKQIQAGQNIIYEKSDRIVPKEYTPLAKKVFIEIPEENTALVEAAAKESEEEFLRMVTQATTGVYKNAKSKSKKTEETHQTKLSKKFFMPDNVETGFRSASALVDKYTNGEKSIKDSKAHEKSNSDTSYLSVSDVKRRKLINTSADDVLSAEFTFDDDDGDDLESLLAKDSWKPSIQRYNGNIPNDLSKYSSVADVPVAPARQNVPALRHTAVLAAAPKQRKRELGAAQRDHMNVIDSLQRRARERPFKPIIVNTSDVPILVEESGSDSMSTSTQVERLPDNCTIPRTQSIKTNSILRSFENARRDPVIDPADFSPSDGCLSPQKLQQFQVKWKGTPAAQIDDSYFEPKHVENISCSIGHSSKMYTFLDFMNNLRMRPDP